MIYAIRVTAGQERMIAEILLKKAKAEKLSIYAIANLEAVKGYLFVETSDESNLMKLIQKVKHVKGFIREAVPTDEIAKLIKTVKEPALTVEVGDIIEMSAGPFKGEKAKVTKIDESKDEVTVELMEVAVPIPVTVKSKMVKLFQKKDIV